MTENQAETEEGDVSHRTCRLTELSLLEQEEHSLLQYVEAAKERYEKTKSFSHDIKNHITVVKNLHHEISRF